MGLGVVDLHAWSGQRLQGDTHSLVCAMTSELANFAGLTLWRPISIELDQLVTNHSPAPNINNWQRRRALPRTNLGLLETSCDLRVVSPLILLVDNTRSESCKSSDATPLPSAASARFSSSSESTEATSSSGTLLHWIERCSREMFAHLAQ